MKEFQQTRELIEYSLKYISGKTLDLGAGSAKYRHIIKKKASEYITFDVVPGENIDVVGDALDLPFENDSFDTIISTQVLEHVAKPWIMVKEIHRVLKKDGICILTAPFLEPYHPDPHDYFRYTAEGLQSLFKNENFEILECQGFGKLFSVLSEFIRFSWFNPYGKQKRGSWRITRLIAKTGNFLNRFSRNEIIYANVYIVAKKR
jgi:SAM-dependent methyltransferase